MNQILFLQGFKVMFKRIIKVILVFSKLVLFFLTSPKKFFPAAKKIMNSIHSKGFKGFVTIYLGKLRSLNSQPIIHKPESFAVQYTKWIKNFEPAHRTDWAVISKFTGNANLPSFSFIIPTWNTNEYFLRKCLDSVQNQSYPFWEACIVDNGSTNNNVCEILKEYERKDNRFKITYLKENLGISKASNIAIEKSTYAFIALLDHDDTIDRDSLYEFAKVISENKNADILYSDEDKIDHSEKRSDPYFKPDWSPELLLSTMYICHFTAYRKDLVKKVGMFRPEFDGTQDYDLILRASEYARGIYHIPKILYHWRMSADSTAGSIEAKGNVFDLQKKALEDTLSRRGLIGTVISTKYLGNWKIKIKAVSIPRVSIIIPTAAKSGYVRNKKIHFLMNCLESIIEKSTYTNYEIIVLHNGDLSPEVESQISGMKEVVLVHYDKKEFNLSEKMNLGVDASSGEYVIIFNDDIEIKSPDWIESLLGFAQLKGVGAVGAKLLFENNTIQHVGVVWTLGGPGHLAYGYDENEMGHGCINLITHNRMMVTGACMMVRKSIYKEVNGWDLQFPLNFNDVDFCLKLVQAGYRNVMCPDSILHHYESASKEGSSRLELLLLVAKWGNLNDPYYNPNFFRANPYYQLNWEDENALKYNYEFWLLWRLGERKVKYPKGGKSVFFSIITSAYDTDKKYLEELAKTVFNQTYDNFEWVLVDNGSTRQETIDALQKIATHNKVKFIRAEKNQGIMGGTRLAFNNSIGEYVLPVDSDDILTYDAIQVINHSIVNNNYPPLLYSDEDKTDTKTQNTLPFFKPDWDPVMFFNNCYIAHLCAIHREKGIELEIYSDDNAHGCHDWDTFYRFIRNGIKPFHIPEIIYSWRIHPQSTASGVIGIKSYAITSQYYVLNKHLKFLKKSDDFEVVENKVLQDTGMWSLKRKTDFPAKIAISFEHNGKNFGNLKGYLQLIENDQNLFVCDIFISGTAMSNSNLESLAESYTKGKVYTVNFFENSNYFSSYDTAFFCSDRIDFKNVEWIKEAMSLFSFYDDCVLVSGRIKTEQIYLFSDSYLDNNSNIVNPSFGSPVTSGGYAANRIAQKTTDVVSPDFWTVRVEFLSQVFKEENFKFEKENLGLLLSIFSKNRDKRVIYSPYVELNMEIKSAENQYSPLMKNKTEYRVNKFHAQYFKIPDNLHV